MKTFFYDLFAKSKIDNLTSKIILGEFYEIFKYNRRKFNKFVDYYYLKNCVVFFIIDSQFFLV